MSELNTQLTEQITNAEKSEFNRNPFAKRPPADWSVRDTAFAAATLICSVLFVSLSLFGGFAAGFTASYLLLFLFILIYLSKSNLKLKAFPCFCGAVSLALSAVFALFNDSFTNTLLFFAIFTLYGVFLSLSYTESSRGIIYRMLNTTVVSAFKNFSEPFSSYKKYCADGDKKGPNRQILLGLAISVPILAVVIPLLISSDDAFEGLMTTLFSGFGTAVAEILLGAVLSLFVFAMLFAVKKELVTENGEMSAASYKNLSPVTAVTVFVILAVFYLAYLLSQTAYFFSAFSGILPTDYKLTAADYARKGFFELCGVCGINFGILALFVSLIRRNEGGKIPLSVRITGTVICVFSVVFTATALSKMFLYIERFGLTRLRLITSVFMCLLFLLFLGTVMYLYIKKFPIIKYIVTAFAVVALAVGFCDIDRTVAHYNVNAYQNKLLKEIDVEHLGRLSDSAVPYITELLNDENEDINSRAANVLYERAENYFDIYGETPNELEKPSFSGYNYSRERAKALIKENFEVIKDKADLHPVSEETAEVFPSEYCEDYTDDFFGY